MRYARLGQESLDRQIFEIFDLNGNNLVTDEDLCQMLLTMPHCAIISNLNAELREPTESLLARVNNDASLAEHYNYRIVKAPKDILQLRRNKKLLIRRHI